MHGKQLLLGGAQIWWTNVIVFGLWFWELDGGGPPARLREPKAARDFAFIQMTDPEVSKPRLAPALLRLLLPLVHELERVQPDRHDAADAHREAADARRVDDLAAHAAPRRCARGQHPRS